MRMFDETEDESVEGEVPSGTPEVVPAEAGKCELDSRPSTSSRDHKLSPAEVGFLSKSTPRQRTPGTLGYVLPLVRTRECCVYCVAEIP